jgi:hypothetical protein
LNAAEGRPIPGFGNSRNRDGLDNFSNMYRVVDVTADADQLEPMGSKPKFWFEHKDFGLCLFKAARPGTGEDWSEKLAERFASWLCLPHACYELASWRGERGIITPRLTSDAERLVHGNELLIELDPAYEPQSKTYRTPLHTVPAVLEALQKHGVVIPAAWTPPNGVEGCLDVFAGYLLLDALIGNTDRHHENWAVIERDGEIDRSPERRLAPTFDHASSLGRNEPEPKVRERLATRDKGYSVEAYADRARSAFFMTPDDEQPLTTMDAFSEVARRCPTGATVWCTRLRGLEDVTITEIVRAVPDELMSLPIKEFVERIIIHNRDRLLQEHTR